MTGREHGQFFDTLLTIVYEEKMRMSYTVHPNKGRIMDPAESFYYG